MRRLTPWIAVFIMVYALVSAPLFHVHDHDDHGNARNLVHAHLPELEEATHQQLEMEAPRAHHEARWIDFFTLVAPAAVSFIVIDFSEALPFTQPEAQASIVSLDAPRAHSPPVSGRIAPRSPPALQLA